MINSNYESFLCAYILFLENLIYDEKGIKSPELMYLFSNEIIDFLNNEE